MTTLGLIIGPTGSPYTLQANPVEWNCLLYSRQMTRAGSALFTLDAGPVTFAYAPQNQGYIQPINLSLSPLAFAYSPLPVSLSYVTATQVVKFNPGHYMAQAGNSLSSDISDLTSYGTGIVGYCLQLSWAQLDVGTSAPSYSFTTIDSAYTSVKALGKHLIVSFKTSTYVGNVCNPIGGANPYNTSNAASGQVPQWLINNGPNLSVTDSLTGTVYSTTAFPASPNPSQYGWFVWDFNGNSGLTAGFEFIMGAHQYHPVAAAAYTNAYRALLNHVMPSGLTFNNDPYCEMVQDIDELTFSLGFGSTYLPAIVTDNTYKINGVLAAYTDINNVAQTAGQVSYTNAQCYRFIADSKTRAVASAPNTSIGCCDGFGLYGTDGQNNSNTHVNFMKAVNQGRVLLMGSDTFSNSFGLSPNTGAYSAAIPWTDSSQASGHASYWLKLYVGCAFSPMNQNPFTGTQINPPSYENPASGATCFTRDYPGMVCNNVENLDYNQNPSTGVSAYTQAMVSSIWNSAQYYKPPWSFWANTDSHFSSPDAWRTYIYAAIQTFGAYPFTASPYGPPDLETAVTLPPATVGGSSFYELEFTGGTAPYTVSINYPVSAPIYSISGASSAVIQLASSVITVNPFTAGQQVFIGGYGTQGYGSAIQWQAVTATILSTGGSSGAYTVTINANGTIYGALAHGSWSSGTPTLYGGAYTGANVFNVTPDGYISVAPTVAETGQLSLTVADSSSTPLTCNFVVKTQVTSAIKVMGAELLSGTAVMPQAMQNNLYGNSAASSFKFSAAGGSGTTTWTVTGLPAGLSIVSSTNPSVVGTPTVNGTFSVSATATNTGGSSTQVFTLVVAPNANVGRPSYNAAATGMFYVRNGFLYDPSGAPFFMRGLNRNHIDAGTQAAFQLTGMNTMRCFLATEYYTESAQAGFITSQLLSVGILPIMQRAFDNAGNQTSGSILTGTSVAPNAGLATIVSEWTGAYSVWGSMPIVIGLANEWGPASSSTYSTAIQSAIASLRTAGYTQPIMVDAGGSGQNLADFSSYSSAIFNSDPLKNIIFGFHFYGLGNSYPPGSTLAELNSTVATLASLQFSVGAVYAITEFGASTPPGALTSPTIVTAGEVVTVCEAQQIPHVQWAFDDHNIGTDQWTSPGWFGDTWQAGTYAVATDLTPNGMDQILNPTYGVKALAALSPYLITNA